MNPVNTIFPRELLYCFHMQLAGRAQENLSYTENLRLLGVLIHDIANLFTTKESVRDAFINWANDHSKIAADAPLLNTLRHIAKEQSPVVKPAAPIPLKVFIENNLIAAFGLHQLKVIDFDHYTELLNDLFLPLKQLHADGDSRDVVKLLSKMDNYRCTILHNTDFFTRAMPVLDALEPDELMEILTIIDSCGNTPLHCTNNANTAIPLLKKLNPTQLEELCEMRNQKGVSVYSFCCPSDIHSKENKSAFLPLIMELTKNKLNMYLEAKKNNDDKTGVLPAESPDSTQTSIQLLKNCAKEIFDIHYYS